jgi:hypothetical protein
MPNHFIAKFTTGGGPPPIEELARILDQADSSPDREAWFGTRKGGNKQDEVGICILLAMPTLHAIITEVIGRNDTMPDEPATRELYEDREGLVAWWRIRNPIPVQFESLDAIRDHRSEHWEEFQRHRKADPAVPRGDFQSAEPRQPEHAGHDLGDADVRAHPQRCRPKADSVGVEVTRSDRSPAHFVEILEDAEDINGSPGL